MSSQQVYKDFLYACMQKSHSNTVLENSQWSRYHNACYALHIKCWIGHHTWVISRYKATHTVCVKTGSTLCHDPLWRVGSCQLIPLSIHKRHANFWLLHVCSFVHHSNNLFCDEVRFTPIHTPPHMLMEATCTMLAWQWGPIWGSASCERTLWYFCNWH